MLIQFFISHGLYAADLSLTKSINLLATCTIKDDGTIGFGKAKTELEKVFAKGRYERSLMSCVSFIHGVSAATIYSEKANFCLPEISLEDMRSVVVVTLKQKYKAEENSVPVILEALNKNWPCE